MELSKQKPVLIIAILAVLGFGLFSGMLSIFEEGKYAALRPLDGSQVQGIEQEIKVDIRFENIHTIVSSGSQKPVVSITGLNTTYQWNTTPALAVRENDQKIFYFAEHMFPGFGFYQLNVRIYYLHEGNVSDVRIFTESSTFEIVETPVTPSIEETTTIQDPNGGETQPIQEPEDNTLVGFISKSLGFIVLIGGVIAIYFFYLRKRYKLP